MSDTNALMKIIEVLKPLASEERHRAVEAALTFLGEKTTKAAEPAGKKPTKADDEEDTGGQYSPEARKWMKQHNISEEELEQVFHFREEGGFVIHDVPGKSGKDKMLNTYTLTGVGTFLTTSQRGFDDATARGFCETIGCYDKANHASHLKKAKHPEFTGDKSKGYTLTNPGLKRGAALVKELASKAE
jgi:hypothetical protein